MDKLIKFFIYDFPMAFFRNWGSILFAFILFFGTGITVFAVVCANPTYAKHILSREMIEMMNDAYKEDPKRDIYSNIMMAGFYIRNNISIAFSSFALGVTFGIGTAVIVAFNAVNIGAVAAMVVSSGHGRNFFNFVIAHSSFELLGLCLAAGAGIAVGYSMITAKEEKKSVVFSRKAREVVPVILVSAIFIFIAAFVEGFVSPSGLPLIFKITIAIFSCLFIILYSYRILFVKFYKGVFRK